MPKILHHDGRARAVDVSVGQAMDWRNKSRSIGIDTNGHEVRACYTGDRLTLAFTVMGCSYDFESSISLTREQFDTLVKLKMEIEADKGKGT